MARRARGRTHSALPDDPGASDTTQPRRAPAPRPPCPHPSRLRAPQKTGSAANLPAGSPADTGPESPAPAGPLNWHRALAALHSIRADRFPPRAAGSSPPAPRESIPGLDRSCSSFIPEPFAQILRRRIRKHRHDHGPFVPRNAPRDHKAPVERRRRTRTHEQAFLSRQPLDHSVRRFGPDLHVLIGQRRVIDRRTHRARHVLPALQPVKRRIRLQAHAANPWVQFPQPPRRPDECPARAETGHKMRHPARRLLPNLPRRRSKMRLPVRRIATLIGIEVFVRVLRHDFMHAPDRAVGPFFAGREHEHRAIRLQNLPPLVRGALGQTQFHVVAKRRPDHRIGDAGVSACRVDDRLPRLQQSARKSRLNHAERRTVLHRSAGVRPLGLRVKLYVGEFTADPGEMKQRGITDQLEQREAPTRRARSIYRSWYTDYRCCAFRRHFPFLRVLSRIALYRRTYRALLDWMHRYIGSLCDDKPGPLWLSEANGPPVEPLFCHIPRTQREPRLQCGSQAEGFFRPLSSYLSADTNPRALAYSFTGGEGLAYASESCSRTIPVDRGNSPGVPWPRRGHAARGCAVRSRRANRAEQSGRRPGRALRGPSPPHSRPHSAGRALHAPRTAPVRASHSLELSAISPLVRPHLSCGQRHCGCYRLDHGLRKNRRWPRRESGHHPVWHILPDCAFKGSLACDAPRIRAAPRMDDSWLRYWPRRSRHSPDYGRVLRRRRASRPQPRAQPVFRRRLLDRLHSRTHRRGALDQLYPAVCHRPVGRLYRQITRTKGATHARQKTKTSEGSRNGGLGRSLVRPHASERHGGFPPPGPSRRRTARHWLERARSRARSRFLRGRTRKAGRLREHRPRHQS